MLVESSNPSQEETSVIPSITYIICVVGQYFIRSNTIDSRWKKDFLLKEATGGNALGTLEGVFYIDKRKHLKSMVLNFPT